LPHQTGAGRLNIRLPRCHGGPAAKLQKAARRPICPPRVSSGQAVRQFALCGRFTRLAAAGPPANGSGPWHEWQDAQLTPTASADSALPSMMTRGMPSFLSPVPRRAFFAGRHTGNSLTTRSAFACSMKRRARTALEW